MRKTMQAQTNTQLRRELEKTRNLLNILLFNPNPEILKKDRQTANARVSKEFNKMKQKFKKHSS